MTTDTTGRQGERQRVSNMEMRQVRSVHTPDATSEWCSWCGDEWPCFVAAMIDDLDNTRAELADMRRVVAEARSGEDDARLAAIAASIRPDTLVSLHPDDAMWLVRRARVAAATASTEQGRV
jgi:hypothetical protein